VLDSAGVTRIHDNTATPVNFTISPGLSTWLWVNNVWGAQESPGNSSWGINLNATTDSFTVVRRAPGGAAGGANFIAQDGSGNFTIAGATATKASGTTWANPSDIRIKKNITPYMAGLAEVLALQPVQFEHNGFADTEDGLKCWGYLADDVAAVLPECVSKYTKKLRNAEEIEIDMLDTSNISLAMVNAIKELAARVAALEGKLS
jgi:hypothetical protein